MSTESRRQRRERHERRERYERRKARKAALKQWVLMPLVCGVALFASGVAGGAVAAALRALGWSV